MKSPLSLLAVLGALTPCALMAQECVVSEQAAVASGEVDLAKQLANPIANHLWSYAGDDSRDELNATFLNPFVSYVTDTKTTFSISPELTYDWGNEQWLAPVNIVVSQLFMVGNQPLSFNVGARYYFDGPDGGPEWGIRAALVFLFPKS